MSTLEREPVASAGPDKLMKTPRVRTTVPIVAWAEETYEAAERRINCPTI